MEEKKEILFVYNPIAGKGKVKAALAGILETFARAGYSVTARPTLEKGDAEKAALEMDTGRYGLIAVAGGDGTLDEVVKGSMQREDGKTLTIGYMPAGSANDFAASHGMSQDLCEAAKVITEGRTECYDIGLFNDDSYFVYVAAFGNFTHISYDTPQNMKNAFGHAAYMMRALPELLQFSKIKPYHIKAVCDGEEYEDDYALGMITNSKSVGGFSGVLGNNVDMQDGLFELTLIRMPKGRLDVNVIIGKLLAGDLDKKYMDHIQASEITLHSEPAINFSLDGEFGGEFSDVKISVLKRKLMIRVPDVTDSDDADRKKEETSK